MTDSIFAITREDRSKDPVDECGYCGSSRKMVRRYEFKGCRFCSGSAQPMSIEEAAAHSLVSAQIHAKRVAAIRTVVREMIVTGLIKPRIK